jgi:hypothetical protein
MSERQPWYLDPKIFEELASATQECPSSPDRTEKGWLDRNVENLGDNGLGILISIIGGGILSAITGGAFSSTDS